MTERQRQKDRDRKTETERQRQKDRDRKTETERQKDRNRQKQTETDRDRKTVTERFVLSKISILIIYTFETAN